jgi:hypothetical protein
VILGSAVVAGPAVRAGAAEFGERVTRTRIKARPGPAGLSRIPGNVGSSR